MKHILDYKSFENNTYHSDYNEHDIVLVRYEVTNEDPVITPVKIVKRHSKNTFTVSHDVEGSQLKNFPDFVVKYSQIISPFKQLDSPMDSNWLTTNPNINPDVSGSIAGGNTPPQSDITQLPANQNPSNDIAI